MKLMALQISFDIFWERLCISDPQNISIHLLPSTRQIYCRNAWAESVRKARLCTKELVTDFILSSSIHVCGSMILLLGRCFPSTQGGLHQSGKLLVCGSTHLTMVMWSIVELIVEDLTIPYAFSVILWSCLNGRARPLGSREDTHSLKFALKNRAYRHTSEMLRCCVRIS